MKIHKIALTALAAAIISGCAASAPMTAEQKHCRIVSQQTPRDSRITKIYKGMNQVPTYHSESHRRSNSYAACMERLKKE